MSKGKWIGAGCMLAMGATTAGCPLLIGVDADYHLVGEGGGGQAGAGNGAGTSLAGGNGNGTGNHAGGNGSGASGGGDGCVAEAVYACYTGPAGTEGTGICHGGTKKCNAGGLDYGPCTGEQTPEPETCGVPLRDEDCDGKVDEQLAACPVQQIAAGEWFTCALLLGEDVKCWGYNGDGELGLGDMIHRGDKPDQMGGNLPRVDLGSNKTASFLGVGYNHACARLHDGTVKCWGWNDFAQLGLGDKNHRGDEAGEMGELLPIVDLGTELAVTGLAAGGAHTCVLFKDGRLKCWGNNVRGQLGLGHTERLGDEPGEMGVNLPFVDFGAAQQAKAMVVGAGHTCALMTDGRLKCWGWNEFGQLGQGDTSDRGDGPGEMGNSLPFVKLGNQAIAIAGRSKHTCALLDGGEVKCWGDNSHGQLGLGDTNHRGDEPGEMGNSLPAVDLGTGKTAIAVSGGVRHTCALLAGGSVKCWGQNLHGQLGQGDSSDRGDQPGEMGDNLPAVNLGAGKTAVAISADGEHTCALLNDGGVKCWGRNFAGQLGLGDTANRGDAPGEMGDGLPALDLL